MIMSALVQYENDYVCPSSGKIKKNLLIIRLLLHGTPKEILFYFPENRKSK